MQQLSNYSFWAGGGALQANARNAGSYLYVKVVSNMSVNFACVHVKAAIKLNVRGGLRKSSLWRLLWRSRLRGEALRRVWNISLLWLPTSWVSQQWQNLLGLHEILSSSNSPSRSKSLKHSGFSPWQQIIPRLIVILCASLYHHRVVGSSRSSFFLTSLLLDI